MHITALASIMTSSMRWPPNVLIPFRMTVPLGNSSLASVISALVLQKYSTAGLPTSMVPHRRARADSRLIGMLTHSILVIGALTQAAAARAVIAAEALRVSTRLTAHSTSVPRNSRGDIDCDASSLGSGS